MSFIAFFGPGIGGGELLLVLAAALLLFGSKRLPGIARSLGKTIEEWQRAARSIQNELLSALPEEEAGDKDVPLPSQESSRARPSASSAHEGSPGDTPSPRGESYDRVG